MESTDKCDAVISHFNGKFIKTPPGVPGKRPISTNQLFSLFEQQHCSQGLALLLNSFKLQ